MRIDAFDPAAGRLAATARRRGWGRGRGARTNLRIALQAVRSVARGVALGVAIGVTTLALASVASAQVPPALGGGAGVHDPRSAIKPLRDREGVVSWALLSSVTTRVEKARVVPVFPSAVRALHGKKVKVQGFMMPLEPGKPQAHFLLSAVPTTCNFCVPAGAEGLIEVFAGARPVPYSEDAITLEGRLSVLDNDKYGLLYRLDAAVFVP